MTLTPIFLVLLALYFQQAAIHARRMNQTVGRDASTAEAFYGVLSAVLIIISLVAWTTTDVI